MAFNYMENISYNNNRPNFERDSVKTVAQLLAVNPTEKGYDYGHIVFCEEDGKHYKFNYNYENPPKESEKDSVTGWFVPSDGTRKALKNSDGDVLSKGYIILNNIRDFVSQLNDDDSIYEIRDYFDLNGETITLPKNCVLKFEGGMLANGTINGNGVTIEAPLTRIFNDDITLKGDFNCDFYPEWFGAISTTKNNLTYTEVINPGFPFTATQPITGAFGKWIGFSTIADLEKDGLLKKIKFSGPALSDHTFNIRISKKNRDSNGNITGCSTVLDNLSVILLSGNNEIDVSNLNITFKKNYVLEIYIENILAGSPIYNVIKYQSGDSTKYVQYRDQTIAAPRFNMFTIDAVISYNEQIDNAAVFNNAIDQIYNMNGAHDLILTGAYLIRDTIFLKPKVSLIGRYGKSAYDASLGDKEIGSGFLVDFEDNNRYAIDSCVTQLRKDDTYAGKKLAIIKHNHLWFDAGAAAEDSYTLSDVIVNNSGNEVTDNSITGKLWFNGWRKSTNIKNITLQPLNKPTQSSEIPFGGIRLISWFSGTIDSVTIQGFAVCLNIAESWSCYINRLNIKTYYIGVYLGKFCTQCDIRNSDIERVGNNVVFNHKDAALVYRSKSNLSLPYDEEGRVEGDEGFTHSITKYIVTPESVDETFISTNYPEPNSNVVTLEQGTVSGTGLYEISSNYCRTPMFTKFKLTVNKEYTISKLVQYDLDGTFIARYDNGVIDNKNVVWGKRFLQINDTNYKWIAVISKNNNTEMIVPSEKIISSFLSGTYLFNSTQLLTVAIMTESYDYDMTKLLLDNIVFQLIDGIFINTNDCNVSFNFCYIEKVSKLGLYTNWGTVKWLNPSFEGTPINPYGAVTKTGQIKVEGVPHIRCYPHYTYDEFKNRQIGTKEARYIISDGGLFYDKFTITPATNTEYNNTIPLQGTVVPGSVAAAKEMIPIDNTYHVGYWPFLRYYAYEYPELASGLSSRSITSFYNIISRHNPDIATFCTYGYGTDFSGADTNGSVPLLRNKKFTIIQITDKDNSNNNATNIFPLRHTMRLFNSDITIEGFEFYKTMKSEVDGKSPVTLEHLFEVSGKCRIVATNGRSENSKNFIKLAAGPNNEPVELEFTAIKNWYWHSEFIDNPDNVKYKVKIYSANYPDGYTLTNTTPPTKGVAKGETFVYNGITLVWNGSSWDTQLIPNYDLYVALGAEYNNTGADITKTAPWGEVTHKNGCWYYNGIGDLSTNDMSQIYSHKDILTTGAGIRYGTARFDSLRTIAPMEFAQSVSQIPIDSVRFFFRCEKLQVLRWARKGPGFYDNTEVAFDTTNVNAMPKMGTSMEKAFSESFRLQYIYPINVSDTTNMTNAFLMGINCALRDVRLYGLKASVDFKECPHLKKECLMYIISNAKPTTAITIKLHATAHTNLAEDAEIVAKLDEKNAALSANGGSISLVSD